MVDADAIDARATSGLAARTALDGFSRRFDGLSLSEAAPRPILSLAAGVGSDAARDSIASVFGTAPPGIGESATADGAVLLGLQRDQWFALGAPAGETEDRSDPAAELAPAPASERAPDPVPSLRDALHPDVALTDQSDAWATLVIAGTKAVAALERTCRLDLHVEAFPVGRVARTAMEHLSVIVLRDAVDRFTLLSPRSGAGSFLHAMETSAENVAG